MQKDLMQSALSDSRHEQWGPLHHVLPAACSGWLWVLLVFGHMCESMQDASVEKPSQSESSLNKPANVALLVPAPAKV